MSPAKAAGGFDTLLAYLRDARGFDFTGYKPVSLQRRIKKRMSDVGIEDIARYQEHLEAEPDEFVHLFNTILINVTSFFRDGQAWDYLQASIIPQIIGDDGASSPIRIWSAGCASGEEAYTLAMLFAEPLGEERFRERVKIYATDVDEEALTEARHASYTEAQIEAVPQSMRHYFQQSGGRYVFLPEFRRSVIFGRHDLVQDAPISHMDLIVCRNVLMYFNPDTQARILSNLHFGLKTDGYLFLGHAEMMLSHSDQYATVDLAHRVFRPRARFDPRGFAPPAAAIAAPTTITPDLGPAMIETAPYAQVILDLGGRVAVINEAAKELFALTDADRGRPFQDLEISYRPFELRPHVEDAMNGGKPVRLHDQQRTLPDGSAQYFDVRVAPLTDAGGNLLGVGIHIEDTSEFKQLQIEHLRASQELETAYEELQSTNEELETTNEELQSTVEELETTNEELQSTNEELETMNEELQSTNTELQALNEEYGRADAELRALNAFLGSVLTSIHTGLAVVNDRIEVLSWNQQAEELWGIRADEVRGRRLLELDIGLPVEALRAPIVACLTGSLEEVLSLEAVNRRGRSIQCKVTCTPLETSGEGVHEVVILMETGKRPRAG